MTLDENATSWTMAHSDRPETHVNNAALSGIFTKFL